MTSGIGPIGFDLHSRSAAVTSYECAHAFTTARGEHESAHGCYGHAWHMHVRASTPAGGGPRRAAGGWTPRRAADRRAPWRALRCRGAQRACAIAIGEGRCGGSPIVGPSWRQGRHTSSTHKKNACQESSVYGQSGRTWQVRSLAQATEGGLASQEGGVQGGGPHGARQP